MSDVITVKHEEIANTNGTYYISIMTYHQEIDEKPEVVQQITGEVLMKLVKEFHTLNAIEKQKSACLITDLTPIADSITEDSLGKWYDNATEDDIQTQQQLFQMFKRPVFSILALPGIDPDYITKKSREVNSSANPVRVVKTIGEGIQLANHLLRIAHES